MSRDCDFRRARHEELPINGHLYPMAHEDVDVLSSTVGKQNSLMLAFGANV